MCVCLCVCVCVCVCVCARARARARGLTADKWVGEGEGGNNAVRDSCCTVAVSVCQYVGHTPDVDLHQSVTSLVWCSASLQTPDLASCALKKVFDTEPSCTVLILLLFVKF